MDHSLEGLLSDVAAGRSTAEEAAVRLRRFGYSGVGDYARLDVSRAARKGVPEVVFAEGKTSEQLVAIVVSFLTHSPLVLCSRVSDEQAEALTAGVSGEVEHERRSRVVVARRAGAPPPEPRGTVGVFAAGTSDVGVAGEAVAVCRAMGVGVVTAFDVGVAGLHRLAAPLDEMHAAEVSAVIVAAGMEGALPSVIAGLVDVPVIGLPTATGYGFGGHGEAALLGMLQSCSPGLVVVNVDNGIGAGATAALIARGGGGGMKAITFILRDSREELWRRWADQLQGHVGSDYHELIASPLGERMLRTILEDLITYSEAEDYEIAGVLKKVEERATAETGHRLALGFTIMDMVVSLQVLRGAMSDVLVDSLVRDEMPSFAATLDQYKVICGFLDRMVCATMLAE